MEKNIRDLIAIFSLQRWHFPQVWKSFVFSLFFSLYPSMPKLRKGWSRYVLVRPVFLLTCWEVLCILWWGDLWCWLNGCRFSLSGVNRCDLIDYGWIFCGEIIIDVFCWDELCCDVMWCEVKYDETWCFVMRCVVEKLSVLLWAVLWYCRLRCCLVWILI